MKYRQVKLVLSGIFYPPGGRNKERMKEGEYGGSFMYLCMKMEQ
jgi:hypothetical protein